MKTCFPWSQTRSTISSAGQPSPTAAIRLPSALMAWDGPPWRVANADAPAGASRRTGRSLAVASQARAVPNRETVTSRSPSAENAIPAINSSGTFSVVRIRPVSVSCRVTVRRCGARRARRPPSGLRTNDPSSPSDAGGPKSRRPSAASHTRSADDECASRRPSGLQARS